MKPASTKPEPEHPDAAGGASIEGAAGRTDARAAERNGAVARAGPRRQRLRQLAASGRARSALSVGGVFAVLAVPLGIALAELFRTRWYPTLDLAQTEIRVRDVWSSHPPLIGLAGRIGTFGEGGSHPGPLSFWTLWPFYEVFGRGSWALEAAAVALNLVAVGGALWLAHRRGGTALVLAVGVVLALLMRAYGATLLTEPWNPYLPILWWFLLLLAVWSVLCDDLVALPVVVFTASYCMQTHVSYLGLGSGLAALSIAVLAYRAWKRREQRTERRRALRWGLLSLVLAVVVWTPPVIDQIVHSPGNLSILWGHFTDPPEPAIGFGEGLRALVRNLNPWTLVERLGFVAGVTRGVGGSMVPGVLFVVAWAATAVVAWRLRHRALVRLHAVVAVTLVLGVVSASRINGFVWFYLLLWAWGVAALMLLAVSWTAVVVGSRALPDAIRLRAARTAPVVLVAVMVVVTTSFVVSAASVDVPASRLSETVGKVSGPTAEALRTRPGDAPYLVTWLPDPLTIGAEGYGLLGELLRRGFDARADQVHHGGATPYRVMNPADATLEVHLAIGPEIDKWRAKPAFAEIASFDPRTPEERAEFEYLRAQVIDGLDETADPDLVRAVDENLFVLTFDDRVPETVKARIDRMEALALPAAVFIGPPAPAG